MKPKGFLQYIGQTDEIRKARAFWDWFTAHQNEYLFIEEVDVREKRRLMELLLTELHHYNGYLDFEIEGNRHYEKFELVITAEGVVEQFPSLELLAELAPRLDDWEVIAYKQPRGDQLKVEIGDYIFDPHTIIFIPLASDLNMQAIGLQICYADYSEAEKDIYKMGTRLLLDNLLGEKTASLDINFLKISAIPHEISQFDYRYLSDLEDYIKRKKRPY